MTVSEVKRHKLGSLLSKRFGTFQVGLAWSRLRTSARKHFGSWDETLRAAGLRD